MKKTFNLTHPKIKPARLYDSLRCDVNRYIKRERKKALPEDVDYWDFDCRFGASQDEAEPVHVGDLSKRIGEAEKEGLESLYVEILAKPATRNRKTKPDAEEE